MQAILIRNGDSGAFKCYQRYMAFLRRNGLNLVVAISRVPEALPEPCQHVGHVGHSSATCHFPCWYGHLANYQRSLIQNPFDSVGCGAAIAINVLMSAFDQHALSTLLDQQRYEEIAPQLDEEELKVHKRYISPSEESMYLSLPSFLEDCHQTY